MSCCLITNLSLPGLGLCANERRPFWVPRRAKPPRAPYCELGLALEDTKAENQLLTLLGFTGQCLACVYIDFLVQPVNLNNLCQRVQCKDQNLLTLEVRLWRNTSEFFIPNSALFSEVCRVYTSYSNYENQYKTSKYFYFFKSFPF